MILTFNNFFYPITCLLSCLSLQNFNAVGKDETKDCWLLCLVILHFFNAREWETTLHLYLKKIITACMSGISGKWYIHVHRGEGLIIVRWTWLTWLNWCRYSRSTSVKRKCLCLVGPGLEPSLRPTVVFDSRPVFMVPSTLLCLSGVSSLAVLVEDDGNSAVTTGLAKVVRASREGLRSRLNWSSLRNGNCLFGAPWMMAGSLSSLPIVNAFVSVCVCVCLPPCWEGTVYTNN